MICSPSNVSTRPTCSGVVSIIRLFMDTFCGRVHDVDMNDHTQKDATLDKPIRANREDIGYGK